MKKPVKKVIFIIPGFRQKVTSVAYTEIARMLNDEGYSPILVKIPWKNSTITSNSLYFIKRFKTVEARKKYILGFSYGAMIAFIAGTKVPTSGLILCSLSPYFKEDVSMVKNGPRSALMSQRYADFSRLHCATLAKKIKTDQVLMLYGKQETRALIKRVTDAFLSIESVHKKLIPIKKTEHNIGDKRYLHMIHQTAQVLQ